MTDGQFRTPAHGTYRYWMNTGEAQADKGSEHKALDHTFSLG
jgi:hypothetical protein